MSETPFHNFGIVDDKGDRFEFFIDPGNRMACRLEEIVLTERGPRRKEIAVISSNTWLKISVRVVRELVEGMGETERQKRSPTLKSGWNCLSPLVGRELAVLLWTLIEKGADSHIEAILHTWRELAREERWWLYAKASFPGQRSGYGWRRALFHALSETPETRPERTIQDTKKRPSAILTAQQGDLSIEGEPSTKDTLVEEGHSKERDARVHTPPTASLTSKKSKKGKKRDSEGEGNQMKLF